MNRFSVVRMNPQEVASFMTSVCQNDKDETKAATGKDWHEIVNLVVSRAFHNHQFHGVRSNVTGRFYFMGGVDPTGDDEAEIWMLSTNDHRLGADLKLKALYTLKGHLDNVMKDYAYVHNVVWAGNLAHINLLLTLGFTIVWEDAFINRFEETFIPFFKGV